LKGKGMTDASIFNDKPADKTDVVPPAETKDQGLLSALVGEKQKYKSTEELAKAYTNADAFLEQLKEENRKLREEVSKAKKLDEVLERLNQPVVSKVEDTPPVNTLSREDIASLVEQTLTGRETAQTKRANLLEADKLMKEMYGEKAGEVFKSRATTPALQNAYMELASVSPQEFAALFGQKKEGTTNNVTTPSVSTTAYTPSSNRESVEGTKEWAAKIRKEAPSKFWSAEFQYELQKRVIANPNLYFGN